MTRFGQVRSSRSMGGKGRYLVDGLRNMVFSHWPLCGSLQADTCVLGCGFEGLFPVLLAPTDSACMWRLAAQQQQASNARAAASCGGCRIDLRTGDAHCSRI